jgi:hypothetical protein
MGCLKGATMTLEQRVKTLEGKVDQITALIKARKSVTYTQTDKTVLMQSEAMIAKLRRMVDDARESIRQRKANEAALKADI